jgi:hypothetical protein
LDALLQGFFDYLLFCHIVFRFVVFGLLAPSEQDRREKGGDDEADGELNECVGFGLWFHGG